MKVGNEDGFFFWSVLEIVLVGLLAVTCITTLLGNAAQLWRQTSVREQALQVGVSAMEEGKEQIMQGHYPLIGSWQKGEFIVVAEEEPFSWKGAHGEVYKVSVYREGELLVSFSTSYIPL